jgi:hypothetical protein
MFWIQLMVIILWFLLGLFLFQFYPQPKLTTVKPIPPKRVVQPEPVQAKPVEPAKVEVVQSPVKETVVETVEEKEIEKEEEVDFENIEIFSAPVKERLGFYESLTPPMKLEFDSYFLEAGTSRLVSTLVYVPQGNNDLFFRDVFKFIYKFRKVISIDLLTILSNEVFAFAEGNPAIQTVLYEITTRTAYFRRKNVAFLNYAHALAEKDIALQRTVFDAKGKYVYSYTRLAIILEKKKQFTEALALVDEALTRQLSDKTVNGYEGRKVRIQEKMRKLS